MKSETLRPASGMPIDWEQILRSKWALAAPLAVALLARLIGIASRPIWYDEAFAVLFSEKGPAAMIFGTLTPSATGSADIHPIGYYTLLWGWMRVFGESVVAVRCLSIAAGLGVVLIGMLIADRVFNQRTAIIAGMLLAVEPFQVHFSQEIRMYSFLALWLMLATYAYWQLTRSRSWKWPLVFGICAALAQYTQNLAAFYLIALGLWPVLVRDWGAVKRVALGAVVALLLYLPWLLQLPAQVARVDSGYWVTRPALYRLMMLPVVFLVSLPLSGPLLPAGIFIGLAVLALSLWTAFRPAHRNVPGNRDALWLLYLSLMPPVLMFAVSQWTPVYLERALLPSGAAFTIWLAWTLIDHRHFNPIQLLTPILILVGCGLGLYVHLSNDGGIYGPYDALVQDLEANLKPGDRIIHSNKLSMLPAVYFDRNLRQSYIADPPGSAQDTLAPATQQALGLFASPDVQTAAAGAERVWFVIFLRSEQEAAMAGLPAHPQVTWLMQHYSLIQQRDWHTLRVYLFVKRP